MSDADDFMTRYLNNITSQYESSRFKPEYEPAEPETTKVTCRDGVELTVDIFRPATPGPYPTIVVRCPYPQQVELWKLHGEHLNRRGYAMVCEWCRGTYTSGGTWEPNVNERNDGADLLAWCEHQDWIDVIGLWGTSYLSLSCWTMTCTSKARLVWTCTSHPALRTPPSRPSSCAWTRTAPRATTELPSPRSGWIRRTPRRTSRAKSAA